MTLVDSCYLALTRNTTALMAVTDRTKLKTSAEMIAGRIRGRMILKGREAPRRPGHRAQSCEGRGGSRQRAGVPGRAGGVRQLRRVSVAIRGRPADPEPMEEATAAPRGDGGVRGVQPR